MNYFGWPLIIAVAVFYYKDRKNIGEDKVVIKYIGPTIIHIIGLCLVWSKIQGYFSKQLPTKISFLEVTEVIGFLIALALLGAVWFGFATGYFINLCGRSKHTGMD